MEVLKHSQEITELGKKIVKELFTKDNYGLTRNWMSQYIAELMFTVESEKDEKRRHVLQKECQDAILKLWEHRNAIPGEAKPLGNLQDALAIIQALVKDENDPFHWRQYKYEENDWGEFIHAINTAMEDIVHISICASISDDLFKKEKEWLAHLEFLSPEERKILEYLDVLLNKIDSGIRFKIVVHGEDDGKPEPEPINKFNQIANRLQFLINKQQEALEKLKKSLSAID
jgi:hypothetical protein